MAQPAAPAAPGGPVDTAVIALGAYIVGTMLWARIGIVRAVWLRVRPRPAAPTIPEHLASRVAALRRHAEFSRSEYRHGLCALVRSPRGAPRSAVVDAALTSHLPGVIVVDVPPGLTMNDIMDRALEAASPPRFGLRLGGLHRDSGERVAWLYRFLWRERPLFVLRAQELDAAACAKLCPEQQHRARSGWHLYLAARHLSEADHGAVIIDASDDAFSPAARQQATACRLSKVIHLDVLSRAQAAALPHLARLCAALEACGCGDAVWNAVGDRHSTPHAYELLAGDWEAAGCPASACPVAEAFLRRFESGGWRWRLEAATDEDIEADKPGKLVLALMEEWRRHSTPPRAACVAPQAPAPRELELR